jgi:SAM-dependent methyltransferase
MDPHYANEYENLHREHWWWRSRSKVVCDTIHSLRLPAPYKILDVGCGGGWAFHLWRRYGEVWGVEIDPTLVARAGKDQSRIHCGPFDRSFKTPHSYSLILMLDVLEHLEQPQDALLYARELLEPGGKIVLTVPAMPSAWTSHDVLNHHFRRYTHRSLKELASDSGMHIEELRYFYHWTTPIKWLIRLKETCVPVSPQLPRVPIRPLNAAFHELSLIEWKFLRSLWLPFGTSLLCVGSYSTT